MFLVSLGRSGALEQELEVDKLMWAAIYRQNFWKQSHISGPNLVQIWNTAHERAVTRLVHMFQVQMHRQQEQVDEESMFAFDSNGENHAMMSLG